MNSEAEFYTSLLATLQELTLQVQELKTRNKTIFTNKEMMSLLGVSSATLKKWRDEGDLSYTLVGSTYYYSSKDVDEFLRNHHYDAYACS